MKIKVGTAQLRPVHLCALVGTILLVVAIINREHSVSRADNHSERSTLSPSCRLVLTQLRGDKPIDNEISRQQKHILNGSQTVPDFERLGWAFVRRARFSFDPGYYKLAEQSALCIDTIKTESPESLLLRAHVAQSLHHFAEAESLASRLITLREQPFDYGVLGDALIDQGKISEGAAAYQKMVDLRPDLQSYVRAAHVRWLTGDLKGAIQLMQLAVSSSSPNDPNTAAWAFNRLALYQLQLGSMREALRSSESAISLQADYAPALLTRARILWTLDRNEDALAQLKQAADLSPLPEYQWALADALRATHSISANDIESLAKQSTEDPRTLSLYLSTRGEEVAKAVELAKQELTNRQDVFTHDALAWALAASGRTDEALVEIQRALAQGTKDPRLFLHAAVIAAQSGQNSRASKWIQQANAAKQMLFPSERTLLQSWSKKILTSKGIQTS